MKYTQISIQVGADRAEEVEALFWENEVPFHLVDTGTIEAPSDGKIRFILFDNHLDETFTQSVTTALESLSELGSFRIDQQERDDADWHDQWKTFFQIRRIPPFVLVPSWEIDKHLQIAGEHVLFLDPGRAFGTGGHASTRLCLHLLGQLPAAMGTVLDVGCGSGILALAALRRDPHLIAWAIDIDPEAVEVTIENAKQNHLQERIRASTLDLTDCVKTFDAVFANLTGPTLLALQKELALHVEPAGHLLVSGVLIEEAPQVIEAFLGQGFLLQAQSHEDEWAGIWFVKKGSS